MKLYNTLTRALDDVIPLSPGKVSIYTCGPTVYDYAHIGHWFNYVRMDTLVRVLKSTGLDTEWVMNITDVGHLVSDADDGEDKLEKGARREGKTAWEVAEFYTQDFLECMRLLDMLTPDHIVKATDHISEQVELIQRLEAKGYTYTIDDGVYYDTSKFEGYAAFARLDLDEMQAGARVAVNSQKRSKSDFALWKLSPADADKKRDMEWDSPWGIGFPGWHIECSAMSMKYLGETIDIHTGGIDHVPVHHTNEIAQSEAATGKRFANYWMHGNHVMVNGDKVSKSLGNGIRLQQIVEKGIPPEAIRVNVLESHYRSQSQFSWDSIEAAHNRLRNFQAYADLQFQLSPDAKPHGDKYFHDTKAAIQKALEHDLSTPEAMRLLSEASDTLGEGKLNPLDLPELEALLLYLDTVFGLKLASRDDITPDQHELIMQREDARSNKDWTRSDQLRDKLTVQGIGLRDTSHGAVWFRTNPA